MKPKVQIIYWFDAQGYKIFCAAVDGEKIGYQTKIIQEAMSQAEQEFFRLTQIPGREMVYSTFTIVDGDSPGWIEGGR